MEWKEKEKCEKWSGRKSVKSVKSGDAGRSVQLPSAVRWID